MSVASIIGTREPDVHQKQYAERLALHLSRDYGVYIRTGGAYGIDHAAMTGSLKPMLEVFLPWRSYNQDIVPRDAGKIVVADPRLHPAWFASVDKYHPNPAALTRGARALHARNYPLSAEVELVLAFPNEKGGGGTGQGIRIARENGVHCLQFNKGAAMLPFEKVLEQAVGILGFF